MAIAQLIDTSKCLFCNACTVECKRENSVVVGKGIAWTKMARHESGQFPDVSQYYIKDSCKHCTDAACVANCPVQAANHQENGSVVIDQEKCIGCGICAEVCPFGVPQIDTDAMKSNKCTFCVQRTSAGEETACSLACPFGALTFGERDEIVGLGRERVAALQDLGSADANLYGETQMGGLHVLYVLQHAPSTYDLPEVVEQAAATLPAGLWNNALVRKLALSPLGGVALLGGLVIKNRDARMNRQKEVKDKEK